MIQCEQRERLSLAERREHEGFMRMALSLALRGTGCVSPNPRVGCVLVRQGQVVGWGYHRRYGGAHAEVEALRRAGALAEGATAYVNLEPCSHRGKTPPCAPQLVEARVARVVLGLRDPNPLVDGKGIALLREAGIPVVEGILEEECRNLNRGFLRRLQQGRPWVTLKGALSVDGSTALENGESQWITGPLARDKAHLLRGEHDAVLVGVGTVLADDPELTVRRVEGLSPRKAVLDGSLRTPLQAKVLAGGDCLLFAGPEAPEERIPPLEERNASVRRVSRAPGGGLDLGAVLRSLAEDGVNSLLVEGGARVSASFLAAGLVDEVSLFLAPKLLGRGLQMGESWALRHLTEGIDLRDCRIRQAGDDLWIEGTPSCSPDW